MPRSKRVEDIAEDLRGLARPIAGLCQLPGNPRIGDVPAIMRSYEAFGQQDAIVIWAGDTDGEHPDLDGKPIVIDGNHQLQAATRLGWTHLAVNDASDRFSWRQAKAYALAANRTSELGRFDEPALASLLESLADDIDLLGPAGYDDLDIERLLRDVEASAIPDAGAAPEEFDDIDVEAFEFDHTCPKCGFDF